MALRIQSLELLFVFRAQARPFLPVLEGHLFFLMSHLKIKQFQFVSFIPYIYQVKR